MAEGEVAEGGDGDGDGERTSRALVEYEPDPEVILGRLVPDIVRAAQNHLALAGTIELDQKDPLPGAQRELRIADRGRCRRSFLRAKAARQGAHGGELEKIGNRNFDMQRFLEIGMDGHQQ